MKIVIDDKIPFIKNVLEPFAEVIYYPGSKISPELVKDADALIVRTRTKCNKSLLEGSNIKFIATATIGFDHIDTQYCKENNIQWTNAPGCNSGSVFQYISSVLIHISKKYNTDLSSLCLGIIGAGNVGSKVIKAGQALGMQVLANDPPRQRQEGGNGFVSLSKLLSHADIITTHVPLNLEGEDKTFHLANDAFFAQAKQDAIFINTSRGEVVDEQALKKSLASGKLKTTVLDVWENEPEIDLELMNISSISTPHIAGYSADGKANGTAMSVQALSRFFNLGLNNWYPENIPLPEKPELNINADGSNYINGLKAAIEHTYLVQEDSNRLRQAPGDFEDQRGNYPLRREFQAYTIKIHGQNPELEKRLRTMGFKIISTI